MKRFWISIGCALVVVNAVGVWQALQVWERHVRVAPVAPRLVESPESLRLRGREPLRWRWDGALVDADRVGRELSEAPARMTPRIAGRYAWTDDRTLVFSPAEPWPAARRVEVEVDTVVTNRAGGARALSNTRVVIGPDLAVEKVEESMRRATREAVARVRFNQVVTPETLRSHVTLVDGRGRKVAPDIRSTPDPREYLLSAPWEDGRPMRLTFRAGLEAAFGPEGALPREKTFALTPAERFTLAGRKLTQPTFGPGRLELAFSAPPDIRSVREGLRVEPSVSFSVDHGHWWRRNTCRIIGDFEPGQRYRLVLNEGVRGLDGESLGDSVSFRAIFPERKPGVTFAHGGRVLNAAGSRRVAVDTVNEGEVGLALYRVHDNNRVALAVRETGRDGYGPRRQPDRNLSAKVWEGTKRVRGRVEVDLSEAVERAGRGVYRLEVTGRTSGKSVDRLLVVGDTGLLARRLGDEMLVWAVRMADGRPVAEMEVEVWSERRQKVGGGTTDAEGVARFPLSTDPEVGSPMVVLASGGGGLGMLTLDGPRPFPGEGGERAYSDRGHEAYVYTSRGMYRPGETVDARAVVRGAGLALPGEFPVEWTLRNPAGRPVWSAQTVLSDVGTAEVTIPLRGEWPNGRYHLRVGLPGGDAPFPGGARFEIDAFVPPQVVVEADSADGEKHVDPTFHVDVDARMLYGGPAASHDAEASLTLEPEAFRSSEYPDHSFSDVRKKGFGSWTRKIATFRTDAEGRGTVRVEVPADKRGPSALRAVVGVSVKEFSGRAATAFVSRRVDRVPYYVGVRGASTEDGGLRVDVVGVDRDGALLGQSPEVELSWYRLSWQSGYRRDARGRFTWMSEEVATREGTRRATLHGGRAELTISPPAEGVYRIAVEDPKTGASSTCRVVMGGGADAPKREDRVVLELEGETHAPGGEARLSLRAPFAGWALITVEGTETLWRRVVEMEEREISLTLPVPKVKVPNLWVRAVVVRAQPTEGEAPAVRAHGAAPLVLDTSHWARPLSLRVAENPRPSETVELVVEGEPGAEIVVAGVDEGILRLNDFASPDPLAWFRALRKAGSVSWDGFDALLPELGDRFFVGDPAMGGGIGGMGRRLNPVDAKRFRPFSWWSGARRIPEDGVLRISMEMPEFTGEARWMAVQVSGAGMGAAEARSKVARAMVAQQSLPLFLAPGDETEWTVRLHNRADRETRVRLVPAVSGPVRVEEGAVELTLAAGGNAFAPLAAVRRVGDRAGGVRVAGERRGGGMGGAGGTGGAPGGGVSGDLPFAGVAAGGVDGGGRGDGGVSARHGEAGPAGGVDARATTGGGGGLFVALSLWLSGTGGERRRSGPGVAVVGGGK